MNEMPASEVDLKGSKIMSCYNCDKCKNKGLVYFPSGGELRCRPCNCMAIRGSILRAEASGISELLKKCKFSTFLAKEAWQADAKQKASNFAKDPQGWLYLFGQPGGGKTHLCTAVLGRLIHAGMDARYMLWKSEGTALVGKVNSQEYEDEIKPLVSVPVLYIDDFLKTERGEGGRATKPTPGHINLAFQIINARYASQRTTLISCEHSIDDVISYDEALGSRIYEMAKNNAILFPWGAGNNYRLRGDA